MFGKRDSGRFLNGFLTKKQRKTIGWGLIFLAIIFSPIFTFTPDDLINFFIADYFASLGFDYTTILVASYTILPASLLMAGIYMLPGRDSKAAKQVKRKAKKTWKKITK